MATSPTLRTIGIGLFALAVLALATYLVPPPVEPVSAQDADAETTAGELVVVPSEVQVGQTTLAVGFHVVPRDLEVEIEYSGHFTPEGESCDTAGTAGATQAAVAPTWITLNACTVGKGYVRLVESATQNVIEDVSITVIVQDLTRDARATTISIDDLGSKDLVPDGDGDDFSVSVMGLQTNVDHELHTVVLNNLSAAFNQGCTRHSLATDILGLPSTTVNYTVYGCVAPGNSIWSYVETVDGESIVSTDIDDNAVSVADPTVSFGDSSYSVDEGSEIDVTVELSHPSSHEIRIPVRVSPGTDRTLTFESTTTSGTFTYTAPQDLDCDDETVNLRFGTLPSTVLEASSPSSATITVEDDDVCASFGSPSYSVEEGSSVRVEVELSRAPGRTVRIPVRVSPGTDRTLTFGRTSTSRTFTYAAPRDEDCDDETVDLEFGTLPSGVIAGSIDEADIAVEDDLCASFGSPSYSVDEGSSVRVEVELSRAPGRTVRIPVRVTPGDNRTVTFGRTSTSRTLTYAAPRDEDCDDETVDLEFGTLPSGVIAGSIDEAEITVEDDDVCASFGSDSYSVDEGSSVRVEVALSRAPGRTVRIPVTVTPGDNRTVTFGRTSTSRTLTYAAPRDEDCDDETVDLEFGTLPSGVIAGSIDEAEITVEDDLCASFGSDSYSVDEGSSVRVEVELSKAPGRTVRIPVTVTPGDNRTLTFGSTSTSGTFTYAAPRDEDCDDETVDLEFGTLPSGVIAGSIDEAEITVEDDLCASFGSESYSVDEGSSVRVEVELSKAPGRTVRIPVTVTPGDNRTLTFGSTSTSGTFTYAAPRDEDCGGETVELSFGTLPSGVIAGSPYEAEIIVEDDVCASFGSDSYSVDEGSSVRVEVELSRAPGRTVRIPVTVTPGDNRTLTFGSTSTSGTFTYAAPRDEDCDDETVDLEFGTLPSGVIAGSIDEAEITVEDDDVCASFGSDSYSVDEGSSVRVEVELSRAPGRTVRIPVTVSPGTDRTVTFGSASTSGTFTYAAPQDSDELTVVLEFGTLPSGVVRGAPPSATITIAETNVPPTFVEGAAATRLVAENTTSGNDIGNPVSATDDDMDDLTYSLSGTDAGSFRIGSLTGQIRTFASLNFEAKNSYSVTVTADDGNGGTATIYVTVNVTNVNEAPVAVPTIANRTIRAGVASLLIDVSHYFSDPDGDTLSYSAVSDPTGVVTTTMVGSTLTLGRVSVGSATITVTAADRLSGQAMTTSQRFTVTVEDLPSVKIAPSDPMNPDIVEGGSVKFTLTASSAPAEKITVNVIISPRGSFLTDTLPPNEIVTVDIEAATKTGEISLKTSDDEIDERDGSVAAIIAVGEGYTIGDPGHATTAILDNDPPTGLRANGDLDSNGNVTLRWNAAGGATGYKFRYAEEVCVPAESRTGREDETTCGLGASPTWNTISAENVTTSGSTVEATLGGLTEMTLYRIQVQEVNVDASKWSGHTLVYPTDSPPGRQTSVATASFDGHQTTNAQGSHEYRYTICEDTIDTAVAWNWGTDEQNDPVRDGKTVSAIAADIEGAIETWETTVRWVSGPENIVSAKPTRSETCPNTGFVKFIPKPHMKMYCRDEDALGCAGRSTIVLRNIPERRVGESEDDLEPTTWNLMENGCSYLHKIMMHEAGHIFGISGREHPSTPQAVMYGSVSGWRVQFCNPQAYDVVAMMANYQSR